MLTESLQNVIFIVVKEHFCRKAHVLWAFVKDKKCYCFLTADYVFVFVTHRFAKRQHLAQSEVSGRNTLSSMTVRSVSQ
jgi:hypothetical protein